MTKPARCSTCTLHLVALAYRRAPWFRLIREPLVFGMKAMARLYRVDAGIYEVRSSVCLGCPRFLKLALKEQSVLFRWANEWINPLFDHLLYHLVSVEEIQNGKSFASKATGGCITDTDLFAWAGMRLTPAKRSRR